MSKLYCKVPILPIRISTEETSEMISQMLYGETCIAMEVEGDYTKIQMDFDGVSGWVLSISLEKDYANNERQVLDQNFVNIVTKQGKMLVSLGSQIQSYSSESRRVVNADYIIELAEKFLNTPYLYGGRSLFGVDTSALAQLVYKAAGISLPRFPIEQSQIGQTLDFVEESIGGELAFFDDEEGNINHIGVMLNNSEILHCYGKVRKDAIDSIGIFNTELNKHTHKLRFIKRILS